MIGKPRTSALFLYTFALMSRQLLLLTLIAMLYLLYKNGHRAKVFLLGFLNFELVLVVEVCPLHHLTITPHPSIATRLSLCSCPSSCGTSLPYPPSPSHQRPSQCCGHRCPHRGCWRIRATGYHCCDVQDGIFTFNVYEHHDKPWVAQLMVPYLVFFAVACAVSLFTLGQKGKLLVDKFRQRRAASSNAVESAETLEEKLIANKMEIRKIYCVLLLGATEGAQCDF